MENKVIESPIKQLSNFWAPAFYILLILIGYLSPVEVLMLYALETLIIGVFHAIMMLGVAKKQNNINYGLFITLFFIVHYSAFCFVQLYIMFGIIDYLPDISNWNIRSKITTFVSNIEVRNSVLSLIIIYIFKTLDFFYKGKHANVKIDAFMFKPYPRIFVQQFVAVFPFFLLGYFGQKYVAAIVLVILRGISDYILYLLKNNPKIVVDFMLKHNKEIKDPETSVKEFYQFLKDING